MKKVGAKEVYFVSSAPPVKNPCVYGIDMYVSTELIANNKTIDEIKDFIGFEALFYFKSEDLEQIFTEFSICKACFTGEYSAGNPAEMLKDISDEKNFCGCDINLLNIAKILK